MEEKPSKRKGRPKKMEGPPMASFSYNLIVISDLHLSMGLIEKGRISTLEDFLFDREFKQFLENLETERNSIHNKRPWRLVINGDMLDFLQVIALPPQEGRDYRVRNLLGKEVILDPYELEYGLNTEENKSVWKLLEVFKGHEIFFKALADFIANGNHLTIIRGNHDVEFFWPRVRKAFIKEIQGRSDIKPPLPLDPATSDPVKPIALWEEGGFIHFHEPPLYLEKGVFIEHGNQYENVNRFSEFSNPIHPILNKEMDLPLGSFFVRYLFNKTEKTHPFADNIKPAARYIVWLFKKHPLLAAKLAFKNFPPFLWAILRKWIPSPFKEIHHLVEAGFIILLLSPILLGSFVVISYFALKSNALALVSLILTLIVPSILEWSDKRKGRYLRDKAREQWEKLRDKNVKYLIYGHTHDPDLYYINKDVCYINSGTWTVNFEDEAALTRDPRELPFVKIVYDEGDLPHHDLLKWNPYGSFQEPLLLMED